MYYIVYGLVYLPSLLPMRVLYLFSDLAYFLLYHVFGYRKEVVRGNLRIAFPEKSEQDYRTIEKQFYRNFTDNFLETLKLLSAGKKFLCKRFVVDNPELFDRFYQQGQKCQMHLGHQFNWEMGNLVMPFYTPYTFLVVYMPVENRIFNKLMLHLRARTGALLLPATQLSKSIIPHRHKPYILTLVADQAPGNLSKSYWLPFFGKPTPFMQGPEKGAKIANIPVFFAHFYKPRRGYYHARLELASENPSMLSEGELTYRYIQFLERNIRDHPSLYLWTHRRWKHGWKESYSKNWIDPHTAPPTIQQVPDN